MSHHASKRIIYSIAGIVILGAIGYGSYRYVILRKTLIETKAQLITASASMQQQITTLTDQLSAAQATTTTLNETAQEQQERADSFQGQAAQLTDTVDMFEKLSALDPQLLQKYSKVYFLNENYVPTSLTTIDPQYISGKGRTIQVLTQTWPFLDGLLADATSQHIDLLITSGYRSFGTQAALKEGYKITYGAGTANQFSADQGYSEHQLGTAVDFTTSTTSSSLEKFGGTQAYPWLVANAYKYGFVLSYPKGNTYYEYEPWHWRFVGISLATALHNEGKYLYDLDQRDINTYLITIFDNSPTSPLVIPPVPSTPQ